MTPEYDAIISGIESAAAAVRRAVGDAPPHRFGLAPRPGEWSVMHALTHVCEVVVHVYGTRIRRLMHETAPECADFGPADASYGRLVAGRGDLPHSHYR
jgi:hypothetical protein